MWKKTTLAAAILGLGVASAPVSALTINQILNLIGDDPYRLEDNDIERHSVDLNGNGLLDVGDQLLAIVEIEKIINENTGDEYVLGGANNTLAGISVIEVVSKAPAGGGLYNFVFGASGGGLGSMINFYEDPNDNLNITNCGATAAICESTVTDGALVFQLGFNGSPWELWAARGPENPNLRTVLTTTDVGGFNFQVTVLNSSLTNIVAGDPWNGSGSLQGCTTTAGTLIGSCQPTGAGYLLTTDTQLAPLRVPEPGTLGLLGLSLLGLFAARRRS